MKKENRPIKKKENSEIRKEFYRRLLYIGLSIIPIWLIGDEMGIVRFIGLLFLMIIAVQVLFIIKESVQIVDDFFPPKVSYEKEVKPFDKYVENFVGGFFFTGLIFQIFEIEKIDNTIDGIELFWNSAFIGLLLAVLITAILKKIQPSVYHESKRRYTVYFGLFIGMFLWVTAATNFINHYYAEEVVTCTSYTISRKSKGGKSNEASWLFLEIKPKDIQRFDVDASLYDSVTEGGQVELCTQKGKFGYEYVVEFKTQ